MNHSPIENGKSNGSVFFFITVIAVMLAVAVVGGILVWIFNLCSFSNIIPLPIAFGLLVSISIGCHYWIIEYLKQLNLGNMERRRQVDEECKRQEFTNIFNDPKVRKFLDDNSLPKKVRDESLRLLLTPYVAYLQSQGYYDKVFQVLHQYYGDSMNGDQYKTGNIIGSPNTIVGHDNISVANRIQQLPDSNPNKLVLRQLHEAVEQNHELSNQEKEYARGQIKVLADMPTSRLTPTQRQIVSHARDFFIGFAAGMFANLVSKFVIPA